ncbi:MAG: YdeI/OmpD-associated family protein [Chloroflexota bacterium]
MDREAWREWLAKNHATSDGAWLVTGRPNSGLAQIDYEASIQEALCFGWIDGQAGTVDEQRSKLYFAPRRAGSPWSRYNKRRIERMTAAGLMTRAGLAVIERAKADGSWSVFDSVDRLELPAELGEALDSRPNARANWDAWPNGVKRLVLSAIALAKRPETRARRIDQAAEAAERNERPR